MQFYDFSPDPTAITTIGMGNIWHSLHVCGVRVPPSLRTHTYPCINLTNAQPTLQSIQFQVLHHTSFISNLAHLSLCVSLCLTCAHMHSPPCWTTRPPRAALWPSHAHSLSSWWTRVGWDTLTGSVIASWDGDRHFLNADAQAAGLRVAHTDSIVPGTYSTVVLC